VTASLARRVRSGFTATVSCVARCPQLALPRPVSRVPVFPNMCTHSCAMSGFVHDRVLRWRRGAARTVRHGVPRELSSANCTWRRGSARVRRPMSRRTKRSRGIDVDGQGEQRVRDGAVYGGGGRRFDRRRGIAARARRRRCCHSLFRAEASRLLFAFRALRGFGALPFVAAIASLTSRTQAGGGCVRRAQVPGAELPRYADV
jgi:hypothetical protein